MPEPRQNRTSPIQLMVRALLTLALDSLLPLYPSTAAPVSPADSAPAPTPPPLQTATGAGRWSTPGSALQAYFERGELNDRALRVLVRRSGWDPEELRQALVKPYSVDLVRLDRSLDQGPARSLLSAGSASYGPVSAPDQAGAALRSAILADAADGTISAAGILSRLPTSFRLAHIPPRASGQLAPCRPQREGPRSTSLLSWYAFLPACLQEWSYAAAGDPSPAPAPSQRP